MMRHRIRSTSLLALCLACATISAVAQSKLSQAQLSPANLNGHQPASVPLLPPAQMPAADAQLAVLSQDAIARSAEVYGYTLDSSSSYREIACPFAPRDLLLAYESALPNGAISRFSAILSRDGGSGSAGRSPVQIIPILHFGVVPFVPAFSNPHSIEVFNQAVTAAPV